MKKINIYVAIVSFIIAIVIFIYASGASRIYSGSFFAVIGVVNIIAAARVSKD